MNEAILPDQPHEDIQNRTHTYCLLKQYQMEMSRFSIDYIKQFLQDPKLLDHNLVESTYNIRSYQKSYQFLKYLQQTNQELISQFAVLEKDLQKRIAEQTSGIYQFENLYELLNNNPFPRLDVSDYINPNLQIIQTNTGLFFVAKTRIKAGSLLLVEKALAFSNETNYSNAVKDLFEQLVHNILVITQYKNKVYDILCDANIKKFPFDYSNFKIIVKQKQSTLLKSYKQQLTFIQQVEQNITTIYNYQTQFCKFQLCNQSDPQAHGIYQYIGLFKNNCMNNASISYIGDLLIVHAQSDINEHDFIQLNRFSPLLNYNYQLFYQRQNFDYCSCLICQRFQIQDKEDIHQKAQSITKLIVECQQLEAQESQEQMNQIINELSSLEENVLDKINIGVKKLRTPLLLVYAHLIDLLLNKQHLFLGRSYCVKYLEAAGFNPDEIFKGNYNYSNQFIINQDIEQFKHQNRFNQYTTNFKNVMIQKMNDKFNQQLNKISKYTCTSLIGFHECHFQVLQKYIILTQLIITQKLDQQQDSQYMAQMSHLKEFCDYWCLRCFGWIGVGEQKYC